MYFSFRVVLVATALRRKMISPIINILERENWLLLVAHLNRLSKFEISIIFCQTGIWTVQSEVSLLVLWQTTQILLIEHKICILKCCFETTLSYTKLSSFTFLLIYLFWKLNAVFWRPNSLSIALREVFFLSFFVSNVNMTFSCFHVFINNFKFSFKT